MTRPRTSAVFRPAWTRIEPQLRSVDQPAPFQAVPVAPKQALRALHDELAARGLPLTGMLLTRLQAVLVLHDGLVVWCCCGWLVWPTGRLSAWGRPLHTVHSVSEPAGAARRLAQFAHGPSGDKAAHRAGGSHVDEPPDHGLDSLI